MALELVTSKTGEFHVDSTDDRLLHARTMGGGNYVLYGCECTMTTANKLHIAEGEMLLQGGFVRITNGGEDVTITNGSQGQKRNTLVCFDWAKGAQDIETTSLVAINGANTTGTPADPSYAEGDMNSGDTHVQIPICRITINGLTVGDPVVLLDDFKSVSDLRETISPTLVGSGSANLLGINVLAKVHYVESIKSLIVTVQSGSGGISSSGPTEATATMLTLTSGYRPSFDRYSTIYVDEKNGKSEFVVVEQSGAVKVGVSLSVSASAYGFEGGSAVIPII